VIEGRAAVTGRVVDHAHFAADAEGKPIVTGRELFEDETLASGLSLDIQREFISATEADRLFSTLLGGVPWRQDEIVMFGTIAAVPRLSAWFGEAGLTYTYSGIELQPIEFPSELEDLRSRVAESCSPNVEFNSVLANLYRSGSDGVAWHADDEPELGKAPTIASLSFGATRRFQLRRKDDPATKVEVDLHHGDLVVMSGSTQALWHHQIPKTRRPVAERINLTFRRVRPVRR
jgi:alkylated DNA repair dioxygenase AlkB